MTGLATRLRTFAAIGLANGLRVLSYRLALKLGLHPAQRISAETPIGPYFVAPVVAPLSISAPVRWRDSGLLFGAHAIPIGTRAPPWTLDPTAVDHPPAAALPWWRIPDFAGGDIKCIWELSRFDWAIAFAQQARNGDAAALDRLNDWIGDWTVHNPPYLGPNWKCAQEASIRLLRLSIAAMLLGGDPALSDALHALVRAHIRRILPTLSYAQAQDNNHATSEAAALFVAGAWFKMAGRRDGEALLKRGRELLERHVARLIASDGSFSQYSLNYHRLALDTLAVVEIWRQRAGLSEFSARFRQRAAAASDWLRIMVDPKSGDAPNLGANDGASLLPLTDADYRDHRPSVQLATALFRRARAYPVGPWDDMLQWFGVETGAEMLALPAMAVFDDGGFAVLRRETAMAMLRYPRFRFRPGQADALHLDFWEQGCNLLRDGGSYSYNSDPRWIDYFGGVESHNTVQFDNQPQMPRLSRFLLGDWLVTDERGGGETDDGPTFHASYRHRRGWKHERKVRLFDTLMVTDTVSGFRESATLRWRLRPGDWRIQGACVTDGLHRLTINTDGPIAALRLVPGQESRRYLEKTALPVLEVVVTRPATIESEYRWSQ